MNKFSFLFVFFIIFFIVIISKLFFIQIIASDRYNKQNYLRTKKIMPVRGQIFDKHKQPLVLNQTTYLLYAEPKKINDKDTLIDQLDTILHLGVATISAKIKSHKLWIPIIGGIDKNAQEMISRLHNKGLGFDEQPKRFYPEGSASSHLLGFVGKDEKGDDVGYFGIEGYYEQDLAGLPGVLKSERDLFGKPIFVGIQDQIQKENGRDLILTIDSAIQTIVKNKLAYGMEKYGAREGCIIVAEPYTLEIIALSCLPDFDQTQYTQFSESFFMNPTFSSVYEPGSIFKPLVMASALNEKVIKPDDLYDEKGAVTIGKHRIQTWDDTYEGIITLTRVLEKSSNVGMIYVGSKLENHTFYSYLKKLGIGEKTEIDLQGELSAFLRPESEWHTIDYATITFGQGIAVTQIQMIRAFASLINGGHLMEPHVVHVFRSDNEDHTVEPKKIRKVIEETVSLQIKKMLESTVENGDAKWARPKGYRIGGKTGTAQIPIAGHYDPNKTIASFVGFAPIDKPKFIVLVTLKEPTASPWGSETAAPLFFDLAKELFIYYNIAPE
ncbi:MAG TPA: penicillin-binding protein 2 [Patescibacteria group bacterium]|nr:penicillin-binding protein 2 [Patescibacteria group bacterium]